MSTMQHNPYRPSNVALEQVAAAPRKSVSFPVLLVARWIIGLSVAVYGALRVFDVISTWSWLADRAIIDVSSNPSIRLAAELCILLTGALLLGRSKFVYIPLLGHCAFVLWLVLGFGPVRRVSGGIFVIWAVQSGLIAFCLLLSLKRRLR